jgi:HEAT repeat protein
VRIGTPALDLVVRVLARSARQRVRAAATTALGYACANAPRVLAPYLRDTRWHVARNIVCALGQIGGEEAGELLALALRHPDARVRRAAVTALGQVPVHRRTPMLTGLLDTRDPAELRTVLDMLARAVDPNATAAIVERVTAPDFETRPAEVRLALVTALGDLADERAVPALEQLLHSGGWFARRSPERQAAALALAAVGTPRALELLQAGLRARADAVRAACENALEPRERSA